MRLRTSSSPRLRALLVVAGARGRLHAQTGRVGGVVKDESGQPIKGATVTAENPNIGQSFTATTDDKGRFSDHRPARAGSGVHRAGARLHRRRRRCCTVRIGRPEPSADLRAQAAPAVASFGALSGVTAKDLQARARRRRRALQRSRWDEAIAAYRAILAKAPPLSVVNLQIAAAYRNKKDYDEAIAAYNDLLKVEPDNEKAQVGIGDDEARTRRPGRRTDAARAAARRQRRTATCSTASPRSKIAKGQTDEAIRWYQKAAVADPAWGKPLYRLGHVAMNEGRQAEPREGHGPGDRRRSRSRPKPRSPRPTLDIAEQSSLARALSLHLHPGPGRRSAPALAAFGGWRYARASAPVNGPIILISSTRCAPIICRSTAIDSVQTPAIDALAADGVVFERAYRTCAADAAGARRAADRTAAVRDRRARRRRLPSRPPSGCSRRCCATAASCHRRRRVVVPAAQGDRHRPGLRFLRRRDARRCRRAAMRRAARDGAESERVAERGSTQHGTSRAFLFLHLDEPHAPSRPPAGSRNRSDDGDDRRCRRRSSAG